MAISKHTRKGVVRKHINRSSGSHMNGKKIDSKISFRYQKGGLRHE